MLSTSKRRQKLISTTPDYTPRCLLVQLWSCSNKNNTNNVRIEIATTKQLNHSNKLSQKNPRAIKHKHKCVYLQQNNEGTAIIRHQNDVVSKKAQPDAPTTKPMHWWPMHRWQQCPDNKTNEPTTRPLHPQQDRYTHNKSNACTTIPMHPRKYWCTHQRCDALHDKTDGPTTRPMHPLKGRCSHERRRTEDKTNCKHIACCHYM